MSFKNNENDLEKEKKLEPLEILKRLRKKDRWICRYRIGLADLYQREKFKKIISRLKKIQIKVDNYNAETINPTIKGNIRVGDISTFFEAKKVLGNWRLMSPNKYIKGINISQNLLVKLNYICLEYERKMEGGRKSQVVDKIIKMMNT